MSDQCFECGSEEAIHQHHVVPKSRGGTRTIPVCDRCHNLCHHNSGNMLASTLNSESRHRKKDAQLVTKEDAARILGVRPITLDSRMQARGMFYQFNDTQDGRETFVTRKQLAALQGQSSSQGLLWDKQEELVEGKESSEGKVARLCAWIANQHTTDTTLRDIQRGLRFLRDADQAELIVNDALAHGLVHKIQGPRAAYFVLSEKGRSVLVQDEVDEQHDQPQPDDPFFSALQAALHGITNARIKVSDAWSLVGVEQNRATQYENVRLGAAMRALGWRRDKLRFGEGNPQRCYAIGQGSEIKFVDRPSTQEAGNALVPMKQAAQSLGITRQALAQRIKRRGISPVRRLVRGRALVYLSEGMLEQLRASYEELELVTKGEERREIQNEKMLMISKVSELVEQILRRV